MSNTIRIKTTPNGGDKYVKVNLEQDFDFIEILSLKISQDETYVKFCSDYGVIVGRVTVNNGFGVPNAKVSVFLPIDEEDKNISEIRNIYPFETVNDRTSDGVRYNLLPKDITPSNDCYTPVGTFPSKTEVLDNPTLLEVYCKYYKHTTTTNHAGDFMIFGVPVGTYTVHLDADISDIGIISQRPYDLISQGVPPKMFDTPTKFKSGKNLNTLIQVKTVNVGVNVEPFWGDIENCEIGITRLDIPLNYTVTPSAIFMGSIFGDQDKHSINKRCRPRKKLGVLCEQVAGPGTIEMIRQTIDGDIESFDVDGGELIDENGSWAYQIPMNLDYMVTDELGKLIYSQDPNVGIPTRASVRFKIGMDETGGEGRLRTRGKYLVPNNPKNKLEIDYNFGPATSKSAATKMTSLKDLHWNKIYTVSNFIPRYQPNILTSARAITAIKDVDACAGDKTPFPYNKVNTETNPLFMMLCLTMSILSIIIVLINAVTITIINFVVWVVGLIIGFINGLFDVLDWFGIDIPNIPKPDYAKCITIKCPSDEPNMAYAPGCIKNGGEPLNSGYAAVKAEFGLVDTSDVSMLKCLAFTLAKALGLFQYEFYNDWVNGSLFGFLLKYKKKRRRKKKPGREKFCEYDCDDFISDPNYTGVDSNENGKPDNNCNTQYLFDTCFPTLVNYNCQNSGHRTDGIREGLIKNVNGELIYAATTHNTAHKIFATDIVCLGSVFDCDWQGIPKINDLLIPTTYKLPPDVSDFSDKPENKFEATGVVNLYDGYGGMFFEVDCLGIHVPIKGCLNLRKQCEYGVDIDEITFNSSGGEYPPNGNLGVKDIDDDSGKWFRDVFTGLNKQATMPTPLIIPPDGFTTEFNLNNEDEYNFTSLSSNGVDYLALRGYYPTTNDGFSQTKNSYYFYFGLLPGKSALEKMNSKYFTKCEKLILVEMNIQSVSDPSTANQNDGGITFSFIGGKGQISYTVIGPNYDVTDKTQPNTFVKLIGLGVGTYTIEGTDSVGVLVSKDVYVSGPPSLAANAYVSKDATTALSNNGEITILGVNGGVQPYTYTLKNGAGAIVQGPSILTPPKVITNLPMDTILGYSVIITDSVGSSDTVDKLIVSGTPIFVSSSVKTDSSCYNGSDGTISITNSSGKPPYTISTTGPNGFSTDVSNLSGLKMGTYVSTIKDSSNPPTVVTLTNVIGSVNPKMILTSAPLSALRKQCSTTEHTVGVYLNYEFSAPTTVSMEYNDSTGKWHQVSVPYVNSSTLLEFNIPTSQMGAKTKIRAKVGPNNCLSNEIEVFKISMRLPSTALDITKTQSSIKINNITVYTTKADADGGFGGYTITPSSTINKTNDSSYSFTVTDSVGCTKTISG